VESVETGFGEVFGPTSERKSGLLTIQYVENSDPVERAFALLEDTVCRFTSSRGSSCHLDSVRRPFTTTARLIRTDTRATHLGQERRAPLKAEYICADFLLVSNYPLAAERRTIHYRTIAPETGCGVANPVLNDKGR
jgi:hypothetical protein